ncbi:6-bladed beta-propeller protein [Poseidonocella pacifica]|uniref:6-bladed beta-propeller protein n=1 Tax=Poseidonocella pacifica TaxID=871651 RepID=A0A1I0YNI5_9RHOB|nr:6-bladed beta-propeller [Poseidonocella pacifica]SFB14477.1 6-bladed beta-propeller protein [Poseidonocella pacifica]
MFASARCGFAALAATTSLFAASAVLAQPTFEHVMTFGSEGDGEGQFQYVEDFAFDAAGNILVTDAAHAYVQVFDKTTGVFKARFGGKGFEDGSLTKPEGISIADDGRIFIADYDTGEVKVYDAGYEWLSTFSEYGSEAGQNFKSEFTDIRDGKYYMPEAGNHRVNVFDLDGNFLYMFGDGGNIEPDAAEGLLNNPESAKFNSEGTLYVADLKNDRVQVYDADGNFIFGFGSTGSGDGELVSPAGIGFDADDNVYVSEIGNDRVSVFDKDGNFITAFGETGDGVMQFGNLHGLTVDASTGYIYVADTANNRVQVFKPSEAVVVSN